jgi:glycosyltransferase involved in cell wall biosynthesis
MNASDPPLVSCLCVTRNKPDKLRRAIACFAAQTYAKKELVIVYETDDAATIGALESYRGRDDILLIGVDVTPKRTLGELRNLSIERCRGQYFCQWDDDDWYHVDRVADQLQAVQRYHQSACILTNWVIFDSSRGRAFFSSYRLWEGSILCRTESVASKIAYPALPRMEDGFFVHDLVEQSRVYPLSRPELYIYDVHATNTWSKGHFELLFSLSQPLSPYSSSVVGSIMAGECGPEEGSRWMSSAELLGELTYFYVNGFTQTRKQLERYRQRSLASGAPEATGVVK